MGLALLRERGLECDPVVARHRQLGGYISRLEDSAKPVAGCQESICGIIEVHRCVECICFH